jgi:hypothetical protein
MTCTEGKQTKNNQSKKDSGVSSPIDRVGGVIWSDLKGPITPVDREMSRYLANFIDHKTNYCHIFLAKTKDEAAKKFRISRATLSGASTAACRFCAPMLKANAPMLACSANAPVLHVNAQKRITQRSMGRQNSCTAPF